jgi:hypothetical protein
MRLLSLLVLLAATGCATTLSSMQTAKPLALGQFQVSAGVGAFVPAGQLVTVIDEGISQGIAIKKAVESGEPYNLAEQDAQKLLSVGMALAVAPPGPGNELMIRAGVLNSNLLDVGLRLSTASTRVDAKVRLLHGGDPEDSPLEEIKRKSYDLALGVGVSRHHFRGPVLDLLQVVKLDDFDRWDLEVPLYMSLDIGDIFKLYAAPKYIYSRTSLDQKLVNYAQFGKNVTGFDIALPAKVDSHFYGTSLGFALGYRFVHVYAELTAGYTHSRPVVFGQERDLGGVTLYPSIGIAFKNPTSIMALFQPPASPVSPESPAAEVP